MSEPIVKEVKVIERKLKEEAWAPKFGSWWPHIKPFWDKGGFEDIYAKLKERSKQGKKIAPDSANTFRAFIETPYKDLKMVLMGMCPYHYSVDGKMVADGLAMSCGNHDKYMAPSLENFYGALEAEFEEGLCLPCARPQSLLYLAEQGVLLTNSQLTVEFDKPGIHEDLWRPFTRFMVEDVYSKTGVPVVFLGKAAAHFQRYLNPMQWSFDISHPASAAYKHKKWDSEQVFQKVNKILSDTTKQSISWLELAYKPESIEQWKPVSTENDPPF